MLKHAEHASGLISDDGHVQLGVYFDAPTDEPMAKQLIDSMRHRGDTG